MKLLPSKLSLNEQEKNSLIAEEALINTFFYVVIWFIWNFFTLSTADSLYYSGASETTESIFILCVLVSWIVLFFLVLKAKLPKIKKTYIGISEKYLAVMYFFLTLLPFFHEVAYKEYYDDEYIFCLIVFFIIGFLYAAYKSIFQKRISILPLCCAILPGVMLMHYIWVLNG